MRTTRLTLAGIGLFILACGTGPKPDSTTDTEWEADSDTDADADSDTDADSDADSDSDADADSDADTDVEDSIAGIQQGNIGAGSEVTVTGTVSTPESLYGFFMAEGSGAWSGIWIYTDTNLPGVAVGDTVTVNGLVEEFNDLTEINATTGSVSKGGSGSAPSATVVPTSDFASAGTAEQWEGVLVTVQSVTVSDGNPDGPDNDYGEFEVNGVLRVDDLYYDAAGTEGQAFSSITGVLNYSFGNYKLSPRSSADVQD